MINMFQEIHHSSLLTNLFHLLNKLQDLIGGLKKINFFFLLFSHSSHHHESLENATDMKTIMFQLFL